MSLPLEPLFCPCCTPAILYALTQSGYYSLTQPLNLLGTGAFSHVLKLTTSLSNTADFSQEGSGDTPCIDGV
uniref:Uncharacterized protein n=1 Tax=Oscillatoriales cyanobacterium SpSt-402 TaxID=2282168 RepID=A0A832GYW5_9CYAN